MEESGQFHAPAALSLEKSNGYPIGWAPESVWTLLRTEKSCNAGNRIRVVQSVDGRYAD
jgi:hypothetical protein